MKRLETGMGRLGGWCYDHPGPTLGGLALLVGLAVFAAGRLELDTDLVALLPEDYQSVTDLEQLGERFGSVGYVTVVGIGGSPESRRRFAQDLAPRLEALETVRYVEFERKARWFIDRGLYFVDVDDLQTIYQRLRAREKFETRKANPLYLDLEEAEPPPLDFTDLREKYKDRAGPMLTDSSGADAEESLEHDPIYEDRARKMVAVFARPAKRATELEFTRRVVNEVKATANALDLTAYGDDFELGFTGRFTIRLDEQERVAGELQWATGLALVLVLAYLALHFRRVSAVLLVVLPLLAGLTWTFGLAALLFGTLNLITGFIGAILLGLGVDHGIHLLGRYQHERAHGLDPRAAVEAMVGDTGRGVVVAALTTVSAFIGVALSDLRAFREFGVVAASGLVLVVLAYSTALPALLALAARRAGQPSPHPPSPFLASLPRRARLLTVVSLVLVGAAIAQLPKLRFNADFDSLNDHTMASIALDVHVSRLLGYSKSPLLVLTENAAQERAAVDAVRGLIEKNGDGSTLDFARGIADLVPTEQAEKQPIIEKIGKVVRRAKARWLPEDQRHLLDDAKRMVKAQPFARADLPPEIRRVFSGAKAGPDEGFVLVFPAISTSDGRLVRRMKQELRSIELLPGAPLPIASESMVLADVLDMLIRESRPVLASTLLLVFACLWLLLGRLGDALRCLMTALLTVLATLGIAGLADVPLNYLNVIVVPVLFGIAVDGAVHLTLRARADAELEDTLRAITGAVLTTGLGFGTMALVAHPGLASIGMLALLGLGTALLISVVAFPAAVLPTARLETSEVTP